MVGLEEKKLLRFITALALCVFPMVAGAQVLDLETENELRSIEEKAKQSDVRVEDLVQQALENQSKNLDAARSVSEQSVSAIDAVLEEYGFDFNTQEGSTDNGELYIFVSSSMPKTLIKEYLMDAERFGGVVIIRGFVNGSLKDTSSYFQSLIEGEKEHQIGVSVDPRGFETFGVEVVPAIGLSEKPLVRCETEDCVLNVGRHDLVYGSVSVKYALELMAEKGDLTSLAKARIEQAKIQ